MRGLCLPLKINNTLATQSFNIVLIIHDIYFFLDMLFGMFSYCIQMLIQITHTLIGSKLHQDPSDFYGALMFSRSFD